ncbi:MAG: sulfite exporter TauE/SafE family protein [Nitrospinae bacterium]|nr:sulfite exporter TauE/SafE family protein [Nitrospinota bacterium]
MNASDIAVAILFFLTALFYSSVGFGGASGYMAVMEFAAFAPAIMKPTALFINILVSAIATARFYRAGCFSWKLFLPFALASVPFAFLGGALSLPAHIYRPIVGGVLLYAAFQLFRSSVKPVSTAKAVPIYLALLFGSGIGLLSGLTGIGGGIFLSPLLLLIGWADPRQTAGISAAFILVNSVAGIGGHLSMMNTLPPSPSLLTWSVAAIAGGLIGSGFGSRHFSNSTLRRILAVVLVIAGLKFLIF